MRTFLEVSRTRHFAKAAETLFVTQAAVSARIRQLETRLGTRVFTRARNNIQLTSAGHRLLPHAEVIVGAWNRAMAEVSGPDDAPLVSIGCLPSIGEILLDQMLAAFREVAAEMLIQIEQLSATALVTRVREQSISLGLLYEPPRLKDLNARHVVDVDLVLVSTDPEVDALNVRDYIYVDWGTSFAIAHESELSFASRPTMRVDTPRPAHRLLLARGGAAYLARGLVEDDLSSGSLHLVRDAPVLTRAVYLVHNTAWSGDAASAAADLICSEAP